MDSSRSKTAIYVLIFSAVVGLMGLAFMKFTRAVSSPATPTAQTQALNHLEKSPAITTQQGKNFVQNAESRQDATKDAMDQTCPGQ